MNKKPVLVVMAAGMGSRYGGLKQIDPLGDNGELIIDFSLYDAYRAGFETAVCIIKKEIEDSFKAIMDKGAAKRMDIRYAYQDINDVPEGTVIPEGRAKPWGTGHAILAVRDMVDGPFAVINADDYYGPAAFKSMYDYLSKAEDGKLFDYCMIGYSVENTVTENGSVARGVCRQDESGCLTAITERTNVVLKQGVITFEDEDGSMSELKPGTLVSMNFFGFTAGILQQLNRRFPSALSDILATNPLKGEFYIPAVVGELIDKGLASVKVLPSIDKWYGVTYKEDKPLVIAAMKEKKEQGLYPHSLWD